MENNKLKVLYIFAGERKETERLWKKGLMPDTYLLGINHMDSFGIDAEYRETKFINKLRRINFNLTALPLVFSALNYDVVFSGGSLFFPFIFRVLLRIKKPKLVWYNTFFTNAIKRSSGIKRKIILKIIKSLDAIACPSKSQYDFLLSQGIDKNKLFLVSNGVDIEFIQQKLKDSKAENEEYILSVGKDMGRDYRTLIEAVKGLNIKVKIVAMERNIKGLDLPDNVDFVGTVSFDKLIGLYKNAKFVVIPTHKEDYPDASDCSGQYVLLDALASHKAIIASKRQTLDDYVEDGKNIILVKPEDVEDLRTEIKFLMDNPDKIESLERSIHKFSTVSFAKQLSEIFKKS